jgi:hypothetical protein
MDELEEFWAQVLSEDDELVREAWAGLTVEERAAVWAHLERMAAEEGYSAVQRQAAEAALRALSSMGR